MDTASHPGTGKANDAAQETFVFRENSVTLKPARIEASTQFAYIRANGFLQTDRAFASTSAVRVGVFDWMEVGVTVPFFSATRSRLVGPFASQDQTVRGLGDIGLQASMRVHEQTENTPATGCGFWSELAVTCQKFAIRHENAAWWSDDERFCSAEDDFAHRAHEHDHGAARHE